MAKTVTAPSRLRQRRVVERPRLTRLLDEATPRVRMLIAPAGFGKTTLAEQWADVAPRRSAWYRARMSATDVAVLATGLASAAATIVPACDARLRERLSVTPSPSDEAHVLAEMLAEDLAAWPADAWLVLDDHHSFDGSPASELFVATLVRHAPVNLLVTSRERPAWVASRDLLYGSVFELSQSSLAMTQEEASDVLVEWDRGRASGLIALADGWPAVIGLAGIAPDAAVTDAALPAELYAYFAEEVLQALGDEVREGLSVLAIPPVLDSQIANALLGPERARRVCAEGLAAGILVDRGGRLDVHPLAVHYISAQGSLAPDAAAPADRVLALYTSRHDWEAVGELVERTGAKAALVDVLPDALDELLQTGRLDTIDAWIARLGTSALPIVTLAQAEVDIRRGRRAAAETHAAAILDADCAQNWRYRAAYLAGRAAHLDSRESEGRSFFEAALGLAASPLEWRDAMRGTIMCAAALEDKQARELLDELEATRVPETPYELVRTASSGLGVSMYLGSLTSLARARRAAQLVDEVPDPMSRCAFRNIYSGALVATASYEEATIVAGAMLEDARRFRIEFAIPDGYATLAAGQAGLKLYAEAERSLETSQVEARRLGDNFALVNEYAIRVRTMLQQGDVARACSIRIPETDGTIKSIAAGARCTRALALTCANRFEEADALLKQAEGQSSAIEPVALAAAVRAVLAVRARSADMQSVLTSTMATILTTGARDMLVSTYRACPDLLGAFVALPATRSAVIELAHDAGDERSVSYDGGVNDAQLRLTKREREIYGMVCEGLSNGEIARSLYLSPSTVKVHVHHIFDKLGIRNRAALMMLAASERNRQATLTSDGMGTDTPSV